MESTVLVVGSLNIDLVMQVERLPLPGETIKAGSFHTFGGGKGANQAVAAVRLGGTVAMVGAVGADGYGQQLLRQLKADGVDVARVRQIRDATTGTALIVVDSSGRNQIVIAAGANDRITPEHLHDSFAKADSGGVCLLQLETPMDIVTAAARQAREAGMTVVLDPAPAAPLPADLLRHVHVITPNETETLALTGIEVTDVESAAKAGRALLDLGVDAAIIKMGAMGALLLEGSEQYYRPALKVQAVDTTAAGDAFNGALGVALSNGLSLSRAMDFATTVAALAVTRAGAQPSLPTADEVTAFAEEHLTEG